MLQFKNANPVKHVQWLLSYLLSSGIFNIRSNFLKLFAFSHYCGILVFNT